MEMLWKNHGEVMDKCCRSDVQVMENQSKSWKSCENIAISLIFIKKSWKSWENIAISLIFVEKSWKSWENNGFGSFIAK